MMYVLLNWLTLISTTNQIFKEHRRDHQGAFATGRRIIARAFVESINPLRFFSEARSGYHLVAECDSATHRFDFNPYRNLYRDSKLHWSPQV